MMSVTPRLLNDHMGDYNEGENEEGGNKGRPFIPHEVVILFIFLRICNRTLITNNQSDNDSQ